MGNTLRGKKVVVVGSGFSGLSASCHLAKAGAKLLVLEKNEQAGGRARLFEEKGYRFDMGPSLFTMPSLIDELTNLQRSTHKFEYQKLAIITNYFYSDGTQLKASANLEDFALKLNKSKGEVSAFIKDQFNDSFSEILNKNRVTYFKELLNSKQYESFTIEALSEMSGFSNRQAMYVAFKKYEGCTPSEYIDNL